MEELRKLDAELPIQHAALLASVAAYPGEPVSAHGTRLGMSSSSSSRVALALGQHHWIKGKAALDLVETKLDPQDYRVKRLYLTPKGRRVFVTLADILNRPF